MPHRHSLILSSKLAIILTSSLFANLTFAKDYMVEVLIFENLQQQAALESYRYQEINDLSSNAEIWSIEPSMLLTEVDKLQAAEDYLPLFYYSWGQESLPVSQSAAMNVLEESLRGWIKVYAGQLLFANLDLDYNGYRLSEKRRIKLNERHYFDHPKFGVLMQVSRLEPEEEAINDDDQETPIDALPEDSKPEPVRNLLDLILEDEQQP